MKTLLIFPHQLFENHPGFATNPDLIVLTEDPLFFSDTRYTANFHRQKLMLHRASMQCYAKKLRSQDYTLSYYEFAESGSVLTDVIESLASQGVTDVFVCDVADFILFKRLTSACNTADIELTWIDSPGFINTEEQNTEYRKGKKRWYMADFYKWQRRRLNILIDPERPHSGSHAGDLAGGPTGGKWSFDEENRKKIPKKSLAQIPALSFPPQTEATEEAAKYIDHYFSSAPGNGSDLLYPSTHSDALAWLNDFLKVRFADFGPFEDAIVENQSWLYHSVLTPALNIGLLTPGQVIEITLEYATEHNIPIASVEGFIRQIIGWREFMRATYTDLGVTMRTTNHWQHNNRMPAAFYNATTGVLPVDNAIQRLLNTGYCHHIERLMVLGGFMFLCEIKPNDIYQWFMELFIDSYDWVMVPNVYAMSQNADGGLITTKPYFSGSNYIRKMSHYPKDDWCDIWDALYWRWIFKQSASLGKNPRWAMMVRNAEKMDSKRKNKLLGAAEAYLSELHDS